MKITEDTNVSLRMLVLACGICITSFGWINYQLYSLQHKINLTWTIRDQIEWNEKARAVNPGVIWPDSSDIYWRNHKDFLLNGSQSFSPMAKTP